jgi:CspA family cold shock protein
MISEGRVKWFNNKKGYGFLKTRELGDVFVHYTAIVARGFRYLTQGDRVSFEVERGTKGLQATNVKRILRNFRHFCASEVQVAILRALKSSPRRLSLKEISDRVQVPQENLRAQLKCLLEADFIHQDSRDVVEWDHEDATFYTEPDKRDEIRGLLSS